MKADSSRGAAGGWPALAASSKHVAKAGNPAKAIPALLRMNQPGGFDCPGCAWPDPHDTSVTEFCENGVKAIAAETMRGKVDGKFFRQHTVTSLLEKSDYWLESQGRLAEPLQYNPQTDRYDSVSWEAAFEKIGEHLRSLESPNEAIFYTSGRTSNEAAFLYQLFVRQFGTNNLPDCSNMCHESSGVAMTDSIGIGKGTVRLEDFELADLILIIGQNPGTNHPRMLTELQKARARGAQIVSINPIKEKGLLEFLHPQDVPAMLTNRSSRISSLYLQPLIGGDLAVFKGIQKAVLELDAQAEQSLLDSEFIAAHTSGFEKLKADLAALSWEAITEQSGLSEAEMRDVARLYVGADRVIACWAMGLTQQRYAVATIQQVLNLLLLRGNIGRPGAGACPVRGHSNVQGDRTMGIYEKPSPAFLERLGSACGFQPPSEPGYDAVAAIEAMANGKAKAFIAMGGNFVRATPDSAFTEAALRQCSLTVQVSTKLNRSHLVHGREAFILPCLGRTERDQQAGGLQSVSVEDSMSMVHSSTGRQRPASPHLRSEPAIVAGIAKATLRDSQIDWEGLIGDYARIRDVISRSIAGFETFNERLRAPGGFHLGNSAAQRRWNTAGEKAHFVSVPLPDLAIPPDCLRLMTIRSHDQYNTTIYGLNDRYRGIRNERRVLFLNPIDIQRLGLEAGQRVDLESDYGDGQQRRADGFVVVSYDITPGCAASYFPETNVLVSVKDIAERSHTPVSKLVPIRVVAHP
jgi:molybdopterin-dependent oxidoreductase alpha subunit